VLPFLDTLHDSRRWIVLLHEVKEFLSLVNLLDSLDQEMLSNLAKLSQVLPLAEELGDFSFDVDAGSVEVLLGQEEHRELIVVVLLQGCFRLVILHPEVNLVGEVSPALIRAYLGSNHQVNLLLSRVFGDFEQLLVMVSAGQLSRNVSPLKQLAL